MCLITLNTLKAFKDGMLYMNIHSFIHSIIYSIVHSEVCFKQALSLLKIEFSTNNELVLPISIHSTFYFP
jgi:hypothetical protein